MSCERCKARWCNDECLAYKQGKADERKRIIARARERADVYAKMPDPWTDRALELRHFANELEGGRWLIWNA